MTARDPAEFARVARKQAHEFREAIVLQHHIRRKLPEEGPEFLTQTQNAGGEEIRERLLDVF